MICIAYFSSAARAMEAAELGEILRISRANNSRSGVTGLLCHNDGSFLQFLEGAPEDVDAVFGRIRRDPRHRGVLEVHRGAIDRRLFADWSMGVVKLGEAGAEQQAFCRSLRDIELGASAAHGAAITPFLASFRAWLR